MAEAIEHILFLGPEEKKFFTKNPADLPFVRKVYEDDTPVILFRVEKPTKPSASLPCAIWIR